MLPVSGPPWLLVTNQKSNLFLGRAVAFLMFMFPIGLSDIDNGNNYADNCYYNTDNTYDRFCHHILYLSLYFPLVSPPKILEVLRMYSLWRKANRLPFSVTPHKYSLPEVNE